MKKILILCIIVLFFVTTFSACKGNDVQEDNLTFTLTFIQSGYPNITKKIDAGKSLSDIPQPRQREGYTIVWNTTDFSNINSNKTINAIEMPNSYKITYDLGELEEEAEITATEQQVPFNNEYSLYTPSCEGYIFTKWVISGSDIKITNGTYTYTQDIIITAIWEIDDEHDRWWTGFY